MRWRTRLHLCWRVLRGDFTGYLYEQSRITDSPFKGSVGPIRIVETTDVLDPDDPQGPWSHIGA